MSERMQLTAERAPFVMLPRWLLYHRGVGEGAKFLYCVLHDLVAGREGPTRPVTRAELASRCGVSSNTIDRRLAELVGAGAVEKEPQILAGGQVGNIYRVWLTPPEQRLANRVPTDGKARSRRFPTAGEPTVLPDPAVDNRLPADGEARSDRLVPGGEPPRAWGGPLLAGGDPSVLEEHFEESPPQPPRSAGGQAIDGETPSTAARTIAASPGPRPLPLSLDGERRSTGRRSRALGTNPRAEADQAEQARLEAEAAARRAEVERAVAQRRAVERAAEVEVDRLAAEALAISACLDDATLADVVVTVREGLAGPLAASPMAVARAVVACCRTAAHLHGGELVDAVSAALAVGLAVGEGTLAPPLVLPPVPSDTASLRSRIAGLLRPVGV